MWDMVLVLLVSPCKKKKSIFIFSEAFTNLYLTKIEDSSLKNKTKSSPASCSDVFLEVRPGSSELYPEAS